MKLVGHGIDIVEVSRIRQLLAKDRGDFEPAWFTSLEQEIARQRPDLAIFYAGRCAAKEAVVKALGTGFAKGIAPTDIEVQAQDSGAPLVVLSGDALAMANQLGIGRWSLSISHTEQQAIATAIALQDDG
ncbi:holo-ACP synthase [Hyalangium sp.]|uniref:holo-ACP synthase n=1 Tax=Hyalangium sp. TaxID=2028555 RepID=UPI002D3BC5B1|nr:holo-ACP synthase [Hyalangium sp.]HYH95911.1 holo-ACP synthase [Hyalangium sp.]